MNALVEKRLNYPDRQKEEIEVAQLLPQLRRLERTVGRLAAVGGALEDAAVDRALARVEKKFCRLRAAGIHLQRALARSLERETDPDGERSKRRLPRVCKSLSYPGESAAMLAEAQHALRDGVFDSWAKHWKSCHPEETRCG